MTPFTSALRVKIIDSRNVAVSASLKRRFVYGGSALLLITVFLLSFQPDTDLAGSRLPGTLFVLFLIAASLFSAVTVKTYLFSYETGTLEYRFTIFGMRISSRTLMSLNSITRILLTDLQLMGTTSDRKQRPGSDHASWKPLRFMENRAHIYQLFVEAAEKKVMVQESSYRESLEQTAGVLSSFLGVETEYATER